MSNSLWAHGLQHARLPCPSPPPRACSNSFHWVSDAIQPSYPLSPTSPALSLSQYQGLFPVSCLFASGGQSIRASASVLPMNIQGWFSLGLTSWISLKFKGLSRVFSSTTTLTSTHDYWKNHSFDHNVLRWVSTSYFNYSLYNDNYQETKAALLTFRLVSLAVCIHSPCAACLAPRTELRMVVTGPLRGWWQPEASPGPFIHSWIKPGRFLNYFEPQSPPH